MLQLNLLFHLMFLPILLYILNFNLILFPLLFNHLVYLDLQRRLFNQQHLLLSLYLVHVLLKSFNFPVLRVLSSHLTASISQISASTCESFLIFVQKKANVLVISLCLLQIKLRYSILSWIFNKMLKRFVILTLVKVTLGEVWSQIMGKPLLVWHGLSTRSFWIRCILHIVPWSLILLASDSELCVIFRVIHYCFWLLSALNLLPLIRLQKVTLMLR